MNVDTLQKYKYISLVFLALDWLDFTKTEYFYYFHFVWFTFFYCCLFFLQVTVRTTRMQRQFVQHTPSQPPVGFTTLKSRLSAKVAMGKQKHHSQLQNICYSMHLEIRFSAFLIITASTMFPISIYWHCRVMPPHITCLFYYATQIQDR